MVIVALLGFTNSSFSNNLPNCPTSGVWSDCFGTKTKVNIFGKIKKKYVGEWKDNKRHGQGTVTYESGAKFVGKWKSDEYTYGTYTWANGNTHVGSWKDGKRNGQGIYTLTNGVVQEGIWKDNVFQYASKSANSIKLSYLQGAFLELTIAQRRQIQSKLKSLGLYASSVDGLYGKSTKASLTVYNKRYLGNSDLKKLQNVAKLINALLGLKSTPKAITDSQSDDIYKVASGSGFYVSGQGHIITNHHVIDGCREVKVHSKGKVLKTKRIADDKRNDLALLKISEKPRHAFALSIDSPFPLQEIIVAGYPFGDKVSSTLKFTQGIVSSIAGLGNDYSQIQIDAALQPGNSGGPILDVHGNVVAVAVAKLSLKRILKDYGVVPENTNFGVKASAVRNLMEGNNVPFKNPNSVKTSKQELSKNATDGTVYLTCWMTKAQIEQMKTTKILFEDLN